VQADDIQQRMDRLADDTPTEPDAAGAEQIGP
jgi:hypothetical protein